MRAPVRSAKTEPLYNYN